MALNKFFKNMRETEIQMTVPEILSNYLNGLFPSKVETDTFMGLNNSSSKEPFIVNAVCDVFNARNSYLISKNSNGDVLVEYSLDNSTVSIQKQEGAGKFSYFSLILNETEEIKRRRILNAYIAYRFATTKTPNVFESLKHGDADAIKLLSVFVESVRNELYNLPTEAFYDSNNRIRTIDFNVQLPHLTNMVATDSLIFDNAELNIGVPNSSDFQTIFCSSASTEELTEKIFDNIESFNVTPEREFDIDEEILLAENEERTKGYVIDPITKGFLEDFFDLHKVGMAPQSVAFYGPSGAGKTSAAQVFARERHIPYVHYKMRENSDEDSLRGTIKSIQGKESGNIEYEDSAIVKALKNGWCCEVQELSTCTNQGAETFFNPIFDKTKSFEDASGNIFSVHPDAVIIFTYNPDYCENNQIATSLLNRIEEHYRYEFPDMDTCVQIFKNETGFGDLSILQKIYKLCFGDGTEIGSISEKLKDEDIEEELSIRQVINWINRYNNCRRYNGKDNGWLNAAIPTIVNSLGVREPEIQQDIVSMIEAVF